MFDMCWLPCAWSFPPEHGDSFLVNRCGGALRKTNRQMNEVKKLLDENREKLKPIEEKKWEEKYRQEVDSKREIERARHEAYMRRKGADLYHPMQVPVGKRLVAHPVQHGKGGHVYRLLGAATCLDSILHPDPEMFSLERWDQEQRCWFPVEGEEFGQLSVPKVEISIRTGGPNVSYDLADKIAMPYGDL